MKRRIGSGDPAADTCRFFAAHLCDPGYVLGALSEGLPRGGTMPKSSGQMPKTHPPLPAIAVQPPGLRPGAWSQYRSARDQRWLPAERRYGNPDAPMVSSRVS